MELQLYIIWHNAVGDYAWIFEELSKEFNIKYVCNADWDKATTLNIMQELYDFSINEAQEKTNICGYGNVVIVIVEDVEPVQILHETKYGKIHVNKHALEAKMKIRRLLHNTNLIHGTMIDFEFEKDVVICLNKTKEEIIKYISGA